MINQHNLKDLLKALHFEQTGQQFRKTFPEIGAYLAVDFVDEKLKFRLSLRVHGGYANSERWTR